MSAKLGLDAKLYYLDPAALGRTTWGDADALGVHVGVGPVDDLVEITIVRDVKFSSEKGLWDASTRGNNGWAAEMGTLKKAGVDVTMVYDPTDTAANLLVGSLLNRTPIALAILSGAVNVDGTRGLWADFEVFKQDKDEPLVEGQMVTFTVKPSAASSVAPEWVQVDTTP